MQKRYKAAIILTLILAERITSVYAESGIM